MTIKEEVKLVISIDEAIKNLIEETRYPPIIFKVERIVERIVDNPERHYATLMKVLRDWWDNLPKSKVYPFNTVRIFKNYVLKLSVGMKRGRWNIYGNEIMSVRNKMKGE